MDGASGCAEAGESWHASLSFLSAATAETSQVRSELAAQIRWLLGWKHDRHDTIGVAYHHIGVGPWEGCLGTEPGERPMRATRTHG